MLMKICLCLVVACVGTSHAVATPPLPCPQITCTIGCNRTMDPKTNCSKCVCSLPPIIIAPPPPCPQITCTIGCNRTLDPKTNCSKCVCPPPPGVIDPPPPCPQVTCTIGCNRTLDPKTNCSKCICPPPPGTIASCPQITCTVGCNRTNDVSTGCFKCVCNSSDCKTNGCPKDQSCKSVATGCDNLPSSSACTPSYVWKCVPSCPQLTCKTCVGGNVLDANGCMTCTCLDPCEGVICATGLVCQPAPAGSTPRYQCVKPKLPCCPSPKPPTNCSLIPINKCQSCSIDCTTMKCGGGTMCCPDWLGCYGCVQAVTC